MIGIGRKNYFDSMVFAQSIKRLFQCIVNIFFKVFIHGCIFTINSRNKFVKQNKFIFWYHIDRLISIFTTFQKMRNNYIMGIIIFIILYQPFKKSKVVIVNIKVDRSHTSQCIGKSIIDNFLMSTKFIKQQENFERLVYFS